MFKDRIEFTKNITLLKMDMITAGERFADDYIKRGDIEQCFMYLTNKSGCDGFTKRSDHQSGMAEDIIFFDETGKPDYNQTGIEKFEKWHKVWAEKYGGKQITEFKDKNGNLIKDLPHFN